MEGDDANTFAERSEMHFNPLPPHGGRRSKLTAPRRKATFQSTPSAWRETAAYCQEKNRRNISIHSLRMEGDPCSPGRSPERADFNPLPPHGGRRWNNMAVSNTLAFQSTPSAWRETYTVALSGGDTGDFNPLPPHGGRRTTPRKPRHTVHFNPLPPHGGRLFKAACATPTDHFNPLPPHGGRRKDLTIYNVTTHFNPLPPHGGRLCRSVFQALRQLISIHSLRMEGDTLTDSGWSSDIISIHSLRMEGDSSLLHDLVPQNRIFQSTPSAWRETRLTFEPNSTHLHFNPLPPHGGRPSTASPSAMDLLFQSTPSAWRETEHGFDRSPDCFISIHSLRMEGDFITSLPPQLLFYFNPLPPHGGRLFTDQTIITRDDISIHSLRMEGDLS